jgi:hypothetical protein
LITHGRLPPEPAENLAHRSLGDADPRGDGHVRQSLSLHVIDLALAARAHPRPAARVSVAPAERRESALTEPCLVTAERSRRTAERTRDVVLIRPALIDEHHHRVRLGHPIVEREVREWKAGDEDGATARIRPQGATSIDDDRPVDDFRDLLREEFALFL